VSGPADSANTGEDGAEDGTGLVPWINTGKTGDPYQFAKTEDALEIHEYLRECYPRDKSSAEDIWAQTPCFNERVRELAKSSEPADLFAGAKAVVVERPDVFAVCHDAGHKGADTLLRRYWDQNAPLLEQQARLREIFSVVNDTCMSGFIHGLFDTLGYLKADTEEFSIALRACLRVLEFDCSDGMGHAAWEATLDLAEATKLCTLLPMLCTLLPINEGRVIMDRGTGIARRSVRTVVGILQVTATLHWWRYSPRTLTLRGAWQHVSRGFVCLET
jgi:hypothetical protein